MRARLRWVAALLAVASCSVVFVLFRPNDLPVDASKRRPDVAAQLPNGTNPPESGEAARNRAAQDGVAAIRFVDAQSAGGIEGLHLVGDGWEGQTDSDGVALVGEGPRTVAFAHPEYGTGLVDLQYRATAYRLRRTIEVSFRARYESPTSKSIVLRLDRRAEEADVRVSAGVAQRSIVHVDLDPNRASTVELVPGVWDLAGDTASVLPSRISVSKPGTIVLDVRSIGPNSLVGRLLDTNGLPCVDVPVQAADAGASECRSDKQGCFRLSVAGSSSPMGPLRLRIAAGDDRWEETLCGPFPKGSSAGDIVLERKCRHFVSLRVDGVPQVQFDLQIRDQSGFNQLAVPLQSAVARDGQAEVSAPLHGALVASFRLSNGEAVFVRFGAATTTERPEKSAKLHTFDVMRAHVVVSVQDALSRLPATGASICMVCGLPSRPRPSGGPTPQDVARASRLAPCWPCDAGGCASIMGLVGSGYAMEVKADGYLPQLVALGGDHSESMTVSLIPTRKITGRVLGLSDTVASDAWIMFAATSAPMKSAALRNGRFEIDGLPSGSYAVGLLLSPSVAPMSVPLGEVTLGTQDNLDIDASAVGWCAVTFDLGEVLARQDTVVCRPKRGGSDIAVRVREGVPEISEIPSGAYWLLWGTRSVSGENAVVFEAFDAPAGGRVSVVARRKGTICTIRLLGSQELVRRVWLDVPGYGLRRTDEMGQVFLPEPLPPGTTVSRVDWSSLEGTWLGMGAPILLQSGENTDVLVGAID